MDVLIERLIRTGVIALVVLVAYWIVRRVGVRVVHEMGKRGPETAERASTLWIMIRRVVLIGLLATGALMVFAIFDFSLAPFLAIGTALAAALGFGAQSLVKDLIAGFFILIEDQFRIGDVVNIAGASGVVEDIQFRVTVLRDLEGNVHFVPNGQITVATNFTSVFAQPVIDVGVAYETDLDAALEVLGDELRKLAADPDFANSIRGEVEVLGVNSLDDSSITLRARMTTLADDRWTVRREALKRVKRRFDAEDITIPFPQVTLHRAD